MSCLRHKQKTKNKKMRNDTSTLIHNSHNCLRTAYHITSWTAAQKQIYRNIIIGWRLLNTRVRLPVFVYIHFIHWLWSLCWRLSASRSSKEAHQMLWRKMARRSRSHGELRAAQKVEWNFSFHSWCRPLPHTGSEHRASSSRRHHLLVAHSPIEIELVTAKIQFRCCRRSCPQKSVRRRRNAIWNQ